MEKEPTPDYTDIIYWAKNTLEQMILNGQCNTETRKRYIDKLEP